MSRVIRRAPDKTCNNLLPLAVLLTVLSFFAHARWYWRYIRTGDVD